MKHINTIWHIESSDGDSKHTTPEIQDEAVKFLELFYRARVEVEFRDKIWALNQYPKMFDYSSMMNYIDKLP